MRVRIGGMSCSRPLGTPRWHRHRVQVGGELVGAGAVDGVGGLGEGGVGDPGADTVGGGDQT